MWESWDQKQYRKWKQRDRKRAKRAQVKMVVIGKGSRDLWNARHK